jgi:hypothetical protein
LCCAAHWRHDYPSGDETAFRVLTLSVRLYGLAVYALTTTFTPALAATVAALWTDIVDLQTIPLCSPVGILVWSRSMDNDCPIRVFSLRSMPDGSSKAFPSVPSKRMSGYCHYLVRILSLSSGAIVVTRLEFLGLIAALVGRCFRVVSSLYDPMQTIMMSASIIG